jgi:biotin carboxylase
MARFLMVESWLGSAGAALPGVLRARGDRFTLLARDPDRYAGRRTPHPAAALADEVVVVDTDDLEATCTAAVDAHKADAFDGVLSTCDHYIETVAHVAAELGLPGAPPGAARMALRKDLVRRALADAGLPNPGFAVAATLDEARRAAAALGYPLVAKPVDLHSGTLVRRIDGPGDLDAWFAEADGVAHNTLGQPRRPGALLEEVLCGPEVSVETATFDGTTTVIGITDKSLTGAPSYVESGHQFPAALDEDIAERIAALVRDALAAVGWSHGVAHTEVMLTPAGPRIVEINPRQGGNHIFELVRLVTGRSTLDALADLAQGRDPQAGRRSGEADGLSRPRSAAVFFVMAPTDARLVAVRGTDALDADPCVVRWSLPGDLPIDVHRPRDNEDYVGWVMTVDPAGRRARLHAERAVGSLRLVLADGTEVVPLVGEATARIRPEDPARRG